MVTYLSIHEIEAEFYLLDRITDFVKICKMEIGNKDEGRLFVRTDLNDKQVTYIKKNKNVETPKLKINAMLSCRISSFDINDREVTKEYRIH